MQYAGSGTSEELRRQAETKFREMMGSGWQSPRSDDSEQCFQELQLQQIEMEMQNKTLPRSGNQWEQVFDTMHGIITIQNQEMFIVCANKAAHTFFNTSLGELEGKKCYEVFSGVSRPCPGCPLLPTLEDREEHSSIIHNEKLGKTFQVFSNIISAKDEAMQYVLYNASDITEQKKIEEKLIHLHKMEAMGTLAGGIAHNFNNILQAIMGYADLAKRNLPMDSMAGDYIDAILRSSKRAARLVQQILTFSCKADQQRHNLQPHLIVQEALTQLRATLPTTISLEEHIDPACGSIHADQTSIQLVVVNICTNGWHAMENETGTLTVNLCRKEMCKEDLVGSDVLPGPFIKLSIQDTGWGMDKETLGRIFEPYFTTQDMSKCSGLGLAVVHGIVKSLHGFIEVESKPGKGSTFHVYIPALAETVATPAEAGTNDIAKGRERILVVDDDFVIAEMNRRILELLGYTVAVTTSSKEALAQVRAHGDDFDLVLTDQCMPNLSGVELAREIVRIRPDLPIILCSGYISNVTKEEALACGIRKYVMKPVELSTLSRIVREVLDEE